jgi:protein involved in polysaccharide export with SLBB domain
MKSKLFLLILLPCTLCAGQSVLTTPAEATPSVPGISAPAHVGGRTAAGAADTVLTVPLAAEPALAPTSTKVAGPLTTKSDFELFAEDAIGLPLPVYGRQLFDETPTTFAPVENVPVPADYVLGPGDQLLIRAWGKIDLDSRATVDRNGQIYLPKVGSLTVAGLRYEQVEGYLHSAIGVLFKDFELNVALGQLRTIQIFVLGSARQPGGYTVGSLSTLVDALFASGGPSVTGSMRHILLRREGRTTTDFDIYDLVEKGDKSRDVRLLPGDVIFISPIGPQIAIGGDVNQPGIYELKGETTVGAALADAGGITSLANTERAVRERINSHTSREVEEFALDAQGQARLLRDGDLLRVFPLSPKFANAVTLRGNVAEPGLYAWKDGMRVSDLIPSRAFLVTRDYWNQQNHVVLSSNRGVGASGNLRIDRPGETDSRTVASIGQNSAEVNWEYALIERLDERDLSTRLIPFNLGNALDNSGSADNQVLKPGDVVTIFSRADIELPMGKHAVFVRVGGELNAPGVYRVDPGETLRDVVKRAGGLTQHSYLYASIFTRVSTRVAEEAQLRQSSEQMQKELITKFANATPQAGQTGADQSGTDQQAQLAIQQAALAKLTSITPTGRVVLDMKPEAATIEDIPAFPLEDGDAFYIPPRLSTVQVEGAVYNANAFRYEPGERLIAYLNDAGGATREADQKRIYVIRADGRVVRRRQSRNSLFDGSYENLRLLPGDAIVVPERLRASSPMNAFLQSTQLASQLALTAAALSIAK